MWSAGWRSCRPQASSEPSPPAGYSRSQGSSVTDPPPGRQPGTWRRSGSPCSCWPRSTSCWPWRGPRREWRGPCTAGWCSSPWCSSSGSAWPAGPPAPCRPHRGQCQLSRNKLYQLRESSGIETELIIFNKGFHYFIPILLESVGSELSSELSSC